MIFNNSIFVEYHLWERILAMQTRTRQIYIEKLQLSIHALTYFGILHVRSKNKDFEMFFIFVLTILQSMAKVLNASGLNFCLMFLMFGLFKNEPTLMFVKL